MNASARLGQLGIELPEVVAPLASYVPAVRTGNLVYTSGQLPITDGKLAGTGKVGAEVSPEDAKALARICALNALAAVNSLVGIDAVTRVVKVVGFVASAPASTASPASSTGPPSCSPRCSASKARTRVRRSGCPSCRWMRPVEVELIVEVG